VGIEHVVVKLLTREFQRGKYLRFPAILYEILKAPNRLTPVLTRLDRTQQISQKLFCLFPSGDVRNRCCL
jgi:hypothetical protein